jgi:RNase adaptor protein for sRNA GlmZ degradation
MILIYSFGVGKGLATDSSHWFDLRALGKPYLHVGRLGAAPTEGNLPLSRRL